MNSFRSENIFRSWQTCLTLVFATMALPAMAQAQTAEGETQDTAAALKRGMQHSPAYAVRVARAKQLAQSLRAKGMDHLVAFEYAYVAALAEEQGHGKAETVLSRLLAELSPSELVHRLSDEEFAEMMEAVDEQGFRAHRSTAVDALLKRIVSALKIDSRSGQAGVAGRASGSAGVTRFPKAWVNAAAARHDAPVETNPAVWWLENYSGSILNHEYVQPDYMSPLAASHVSPAVDPKPAPKPEETEETEESVATLSLASATETQQLSPAAASMPAARSASGGGGGFALRAPAPIVTAPELGAGAVAEAPAGTVYWTGDVAKLVDGADTVFDNRSDKLDVTPSKDWKPWDIIVDDTGVTMTKRGNALGAVGYTFATTGAIEDYVDAEGNTHATSITKKGPGILVLTGARDSFSGGTDVQGGTLYVADEGALGTGAVTLHDGTSLWVNYTWNDNYESSFRNPLVANSIVLENGAHATVSYGDFVTQKVLGNDTSRIWRNLYLTGGLSGNEDSHLYLQGYTSRLETSTAAGMFSLDRLHLSGSEKVRTQLWYSNFFLGDQNAAEGQEKFAGTLTMGNHTSDSLHNATGGDPVNDTLKNRSTGVVRLVLHDDTLENATLDATREFFWMKDGTKDGTAQYNELMLAGTISGAEAADYEVSVSKAVKDAYAKAGGTDKNYGTYGLRQTHSNVIQVKDGTFVGELKADLLGVTQDTYFDIVNYTESQEVKLVRVVTTEQNTSLTIGSNSANAAWFSGTMGLENQFCEYDGDGFDTLTEADVKGDRDVTGSSVAGINLSKNGSNAQYIHTAELRNLTVHGGTLGFNEAKVHHNLSLSGHSTLRLGVQDGKWTNAGTVDLTVGEGSDIATRLSVVSAVEDPASHNGKDPYSARVEGSLALSSTTELAFSVADLNPETGARQNLIPTSVTDMTTLKGQTNYLSNHSLLQVTAATGRADGLDKGGILTMGNDTVVSFNGINFLQEDYVGKTYFLAAADKMVVTKEGGTGGNAADFSTRIVPLGYGFYGLVSSVDGHGYYNGDNYVAYAEGDDKYLGQDYLVMRVAADPTSSWTGAGVATNVKPANVWKTTGLTYTEYLKELGSTPDAQWKENRAYTDGVSVKFGNMWVPTVWEDYLKENPGAKLEDFENILISAEVTKVGDLFYSNADTKTPRTANGVLVHIGGNDYGKEGSSYFNEDGTKFVNQVGKSAHYEGVDIVGSVKPGYITVGSDYNLRQSDGSYVTMQDDTNYVFKGEGSIDDATPEMMLEIYKDLLGDEADKTALEGWRTGLAKNGTGNLVIQTDNSFSGGTLLRGGWIVMQTPWALGKKDPAAANTVGGDIEIAYGAGLLLDYFTDNGGSYQGVDSTILTNKLTVTHMADFDNTKATGDAQIMNRADGFTVINELACYDDAILTLRGCSYSEAAAVEKYGEVRNTYANFLVQDPSHAYGTIRMAGFLDGTSGHMVDPTDPSRYLNGGGKVQVTVMGASQPTEEDKMVWADFIMDLSLNGGVANVLALGTAFEDGQPNTTGKTHYIYGGGNIDNGDVYVDGKVRAAMVSDATAASIGDLGTGKFIVDLTMNPSKDCVSHMNVGFGIVQNGAGYAAPSRGYIDFTKVNSTKQTFGSARLRNLTVEDTGLLSFFGGLSVRSITTTGTDAAVQRIHIGEVEDAESTHTLIVGKGGVLAFDTTLATDPLSGLLPKESATKYGKELSYVLLQNGSTLTAAGNWQTSKGIAVTGGATVTVNMHDYSMDETVTSTMDDTYVADRELKEAFDSSHIIWLKNALSGNNVTLNLVNEQASAGATAGELGKADRNGYFLTHDLNAYKVSSSSQLNYGLQESSTVNIGAKTILQSYENAQTDSGIAYSISGTDAALQFLDAGTDKLSTTGVTSYVHEATLAEGGRIILGGAAAASSKTMLNTDALGDDITADADVVITHKAGQTAGVINVAHATKNVTENGVTYETTISGNGSRAALDHAVVTMKEEKALNNTRLQMADLQDTLLNLQNKCSATLEDVLVTDDSKVEGAGPESGNAGADAIAHGATAASNQSAAASIPSFSTGSLTLTDDKTCVNTTLTQVENVVLGKGMVQVMRADQLAKTDVGGTGLTLGVTESTLQKAAAAGARYLAIQVSDSGRFLYESEAVLESVKLTDYNGVTYVNPAYTYKVADSLTVAADLGVSPSEVSNTLLYIEVSAEYTPEPTTTTLSLLALAALMARRKRRA